MLAWGDPPKGFDGRLYQEYVDKALTSIESLSNYYIFETSNYCTNITKLGNPRHPNRNKLMGLQKVKTVKYRHVIEGNGVSSDE